MGKAAVESAFRVLNGERLPPDIMVKLEMVTKSTLAKATADKDAGAK
jgi:hypothetical protein